MRSPYPSLVRVLLVAAIALTVLGSLRAHAHDVPARIVVNAFVKADADGLDFVVRVPLILLQSLNLPKRGPGYLDLETIEPHLDRAAEAVLRELRVLEDGRPLAPVRVDRRVVQPSDRAFGDFATALHAVGNERVDVTENIFWNQGFFDVAYRLPVAAPDADFTLDVNMAPGLQQSLEIVVRFITLDDLVRAYTVDGGAGLLYLDPRWHQAAGVFLVRGVEHILGGIDHLLFLLLVVLPFRRRFLRLVAVVTAFTVGHSVTLITAALGYVPEGAWFPPLVETLIAASIVYMAVENVVAANLDRRWFVAAAFGLVHGFGFAYDLTEQMQFAGGHLLSALLFFNLGIEVGQILVLVLVLPLLNLAFRLATVERYGVLVLSVIGGHEGWHWMTERAGELMAVGPPSVDPVAAYHGFLWLLTGLFVVLALWVLREQRQRRASREGAVDRPAS